MATESILPEPAPPKGPLKEKRVVLGAIALIFVLVILISVVAVLSVRGSSNINQNPIRSLMDVPTDPHDANNLSRDVSAEAKQYRLPPRRPLAPPGDEAINQHLQDGYTPESPAHHAAASPKKSASEERRKRDEAAMRAKAIVVDLTGKPAEVAKIVPVSDSTTTAEDPATLKIDRAVKDESTQLKAAHQQKLADFDSYTGKLYRLFESKTISCTLENRENGTFTSDLRCTVAYNVYSHDHQTLLIPRGTEAIGKVHAVNSTEQQRLFVSFTRLIMPDGFSISLNQFTGLNQAGETGVRDLVNHHYLKIFGTSLAIAAIAGVSQINNAYYGFGYDPAVEMRSAASQELSTEAMQILNRFLRELPTFIVRPGSRLNIWLSDDLLLPAYDAHTMDPNL